MQQISVPLPDDVLAFVQRSAERECRTVAAQMRFFATEAARRAGWREDSAAPVPPVPDALIAPPIPTSLDEQRAELASLENERAQIMARQRQDAPLPEDGPRLSFVSSRAEVLRKHVTMISRAQGIRHD